MKIFALSSILTYSAIAGAALIPSANRVRRDASELAAAATATEYLPPPEYLPPTAGQPPAVAAADTTLAPKTQDSAVRDANGYEYRTVRRLKLRQRKLRDVSHLYLPPHNDYLPPTAAPAAVVSDELGAPPIEDNGIDTVIVEAALPQLKLANEYLPPLAEPVTEAEAETETPTTEAAESLAPSQPADDDEQEQPAVRIVDVPIAEPEEPEQDTAVLLDDGYHYKRPLEEPSLQQLAPEYLPPLNEAIIVVGPADEQSAVLADDGYHYRAVKRYRF